MKRFYVLWIGFVFGLAAAVGRADEEEGSLGRYEFRDLGDFPGQWFIWPGAINDSGTVVGASFSIEGENRAFLWENGVFQDIGTLGGPQADAQDINNAGQITGWADLPVVEGEWPPIFKSFLWEDGFMRELNVGGMNDFVFGLSVNNDGAVTGTVHSRSDFRSYGFFWKDGMSNLFSAPTGDSNLMLRAINDRDEMVGFSDGPGRRTAVLIRNQAVIPLHVPSLSRTMALAINNRGQVAGSGIDSAFTRHAFVWEDGRVEILPMLPGGTLSEVRDINDRGEIVGYGRTPEHQIRPVLWKDGTAYDLTDHVDLEPGWTLEAAAGINERGQIVGTGWHNGIQRAFLLTPHSAFGIRVDANRDGEIRFDDDSDVTSEENPFVFWLNNDRDGFDPRLGDYQSFEPVPGFLDYEDDIINTVRDLEDFARLHVRAPPALDPEDGRWQVALRFVDPDMGAPAINLFRAVEPGTGYLQDLETANRQVEETLLVTVTPWQRAYLPLEFFDNEERLAAFIFEGRVAGRGALTVKFLYDGEIVDTDHTHLQLHDIKELYDHWTVGDTVDLDLEKIPTIPSQIGHSRVGAEDDAYILFVHGWRMQPWARRAFAETAYKRMWHLGYKGRFGLFSWPTEYITIRIGNLLPAVGNYFRSEEKAWSSAYGLHLLLEQLYQQYPGQVRVMAHSMGNIPVSEALRLESKSDSPRPLVRAYVPSQAATVAHAYDGSALQIVRRSRIPNVYAEYPLTNQPYFEGIQTVAQSVVNYFNTEDMALRNWEILQQRKPFQPIYGYRRDVGFFRTFDRAKRNVIPLHFPEDRGEIFSYIAPAWSKALGAENIRQGAVTGSVDLGAKPFEFSKDGADHSGQFYAHIISRRSFWLQLLDTF